MSARVYRILDRDVELPVCVRLAHTSASMFLVKSGAVRELLPRPDLHVAEVFPGRTLLTLGLIDYVDNDLGDYNEIGVIFMITHGPEPEPFAMLRGRGQAYIHRLPVNQAFTCAAGREIWGFPKTVDEIEFASSDGKRSASWSVDGRLVLECEARFGGSGSYADRELAAFACRDGSLYRTPFTSHGEEVGARPGGLRMTLGDHPIADELRSLGLPKRPLLTTSVGRMSAEFGAPEKL
jgi:hypothetical protein